MSMNHMRAVAASPPKMPIFHFSPGPLYENVKTSLAIYWTTVPKKKAIATDTKIAIIIDSALPVFIISIMLTPWSENDLTRAIANVPPRSSNTIDTVVDVGRPRVLNTSRRMTSDIITARKMNITSRNENIDGWKTPCLATSIIPLLIEAPRNTPAAATIIMVLNVATRAPMAELRKFTASLLTPEIRSKTARTKRKAVKPR